MMEIIKWVLVAYACGFIFYLGQTTALVIFAGMKRGPLTWFSFYLVTAILWPASAWVDIQIMIDRKKEKGTNS